MDPLLSIRPIFKLYWVHEGKVRAIKRYDHDKPFLTPADLFSIIQKVYSEFTPLEHEVKIRDGDDFLDVSDTDFFCFKFSESFCTLVIYIFTCHESARCFIPPWATIPAKVPDTSGIAQSLVDTVCEALCLIFDSTGTGAATDRLHEYTASRIAHPRVTCHECENEMPGIRFVCVECKGFELCENCEKKDLHDHVMIAVPISFWTRKTKQEREYYDETIQHVVLSARRRLQDLKDKPDDAE